VVDGAFLMANGVPYEAIYGTPRRPMSATRRYAFVIAMGENKGGEWDWNTGKWLPRKPPGQ
jgi:hypothetical protein